MCCVAKETNLSIVRCPLQKTTKWHFFKSHTFWLLFSPLPRILSSGLADGYWLSFISLYGLFNVSEFFTVLQICFLFRILKCDIRLESKCTFTESCEFWLPKSQCRCDLERVTRSPSISISLSVKWGWYLPKSGENIITSRTMIAHRIQTYLADQDF